MSFWSNFSHDNLIAAHRGYRSIRAENTISAFEASIGLCDFVELDVSFSKDGVPIIIHDDTLFRTSNAREMSHFSTSDRVGDYTYEELSFLDMSSWFMDRDPFGTIDSKLVSLEELSSLSVQTIPSLSDALKYLDSQNTPVNIEIKDMSGTEFDDIAVSKIVTIIELLRMEDNVIISSFNHSYLGEIHSMAPQLYTAALQEKYHPSNVLKYLEDLGTNCYNIDMEIANRNIMHELVSNGIDVSVFTVNSPEEKQRMFDYGAKAVFTDFL